MTEITNSTATLEDDSYAVCSRSGFLAKRGELIQEWTGAWVLPRFAEPKHMSSLSRAVPERLEGSVRPEKSDQFIAAAILASDL